MSIANIYFPTFLLGILVHFVLFYSAFDVYFSSPLVRNARPQLIGRGSGVAKRLVVFSADGLRSRSFYEHPEESKFLHGLIRNKKAAFGISRSHVPTESRPGHVAIFAGFYEDVSAVTRGWKYSPVEFDHVFNHSTQSWLFGSPDIVPLFGEIPQAKMAFYSASEEKFFSDEASGLDQWVFTKMSELLQSNSTELDVEQIIFFLHLLGLDTNGHGFKPHSHQYIDNIRVIDEGIEKIVREIEGFYKDNKTVYILCGDHGMSDFGSHGSGTDDEILTPLVVWGAGIRTSGVNQIINQIDLAPLQSALLNIPIPVNSMGVLPLHFIDASDKYKYQAGCGNLKQMIEQYALKRQEKERNSLPFMFREFPQLQSVALRTLQKNIESLIEKRRYKMAAELCVEWVPKIRDALIFYHRYHRRTLGIAISSVFVTWNAFLLILISRSDFSTRQHDIWTPSRAFRWLIGIEVFLAVYQFWQFSHLIYIVLPVYLCSLIWNLLDHSIYHYVDFLVKFVYAYLFKIVAFVVVITLCIFAFFDRAVVSLLLFFVAFLPLITCQTSSNWTRIWMLCSLALTVFPVLEPVGRTPQPFLVQCFSLLFPVGFWLFNCRLKRQSNWITRYIVIINGITSVFLFVQKDQQTNILVNLFAWFSITFNLLIPMAAKPSDRLMCFFGVFFVPFSLMSVAYELAFLVLYIVLLYSYTQIANSTQLRISQSKYKQTSLNAPFEELEWWRTLIMLVLIEVAFFGVGNLSSLNSFNPSFIRHFVTTFSPFTMAILLILKVGIPFFLLSCTICATVESDARQITRTSVLLFVITDSMAMVFFFCIRDEGSWLEIGLTISHYSICLAMAVIVFALLNLSKTVMFAFEQTHLLKRKFDEDDKFS
ncbi:GPI ethanolamine phosphate transferase 1 [Aphelenchoides besseyi]|nr:GPI ethanolamine phosphate transferase 1 [Aphelenchoides besseyi]